ncbi:MAG TPA: response regulator [Candidatus Saccharimonadales bacterium]|nr:response regulator [Candidatus Saccharimonadales bacterium]
MAGSKTILIIEDDRFISEMYARTLEKAGYVVAIATTGQEGIDTAFRTRFDVILLDIMLPIKHGMQVLKEIRESTNENVRDARVVIMTNFDQDEESRAVMQAQADGYLIKANITPSKLVKIIGQLFPREPGAKDVPQERV